MKTSVDDHISYLNNLWDGNSKLAETVDWSSPEELEEVLMKEFPGMTQRQASIALGAWQKMKRDEEQI